MAVRVVDDVVEIGDVLFLHEIAKDIDVAIGFAVGGENVVIGNDDDFVAVPDFGVFAEFAFEHADGPRAANIVGHQHIGSDPHVFAGFNARLAGRAGQNFLSQRHTVRTENLPEVGSGCNQKVNA